MGTFRVVKSEFVAWAKAYDGPKFHAVLADPPYLIEFMSNDWDKLNGKALDMRQPNDPTFHKSGVGPFDRAKVRHSSAPGYGGSVGPAMQQQFREWAEALLPLLHPGALVFMFGGTRSWHRLACGFEDAGFTIWDTLMWIHAQGFPKAQRIACDCDKKSKPSAEHNLRPMPKADLPKAVDAGDQSRQTLFAGVSQPSVSAEGQSTSGSGITGASELRMERRCDVLSQARELQTDQVCPVSDGVSGDGAEGRVRDGASPDNGAMDRATADTDGGGAPREPRSADKRAKQSATMARQPEPQDVGVRTCSTCGKLRDDSWSGHKTCALKPAWEPVLCFRAPANGKTYAELALESGSGCLNVDAGRVEGTKGDGVWGTSNETCAPTFNASPEKHEFRSAAHDLGRYPANVALECICPPERGAATHPDPECPSAQLDEQSGQQTSGAMKREVDGYEGDSVTGFIRGRSGPSNQHGDTGGASRFFFQAHPNPDCPAAQLDEQSGDCSSTRANGNPNNPKRGGNSTPAWGMSDGTETVDHRDTTEDCVVERGRTVGTASRFFYTAKASSSERNEGLYGDADLGTSHGATLREVENSVKKRETPMAGRGQGGLKCTKCDKWKVSGNPCTCHEPEFVEVKFNSPEQLNTHPTVKPVALTTWLAKLLLPADSVSPRRLLVPFSGSGSEIIGALRAGWDEVTGVDQDADYCEIARARIYADAPLFNVEVK